MFRFDLAGEEVKGEPAVVVFKSHLSPARVSLLRPAHVISLHQLRMRDHFEDLTHRQHNALTLHQERLHKYRVIQAMRIPNSVQTTKACRGEGLIDLSKIL